MKGIISVVSESFSRDDGNRRHQREPVDKLGLAWRFTLMNESVSQEFITRRSCPEGPMQIVERQIARKKPKP